ARGVINATIAVVNDGAAANSYLYFWLVVGLVLTLLEGLQQLGLNFLSRRLEDDVNLAVTTQILEHAAYQDLAFFENEKSRATIERAQQNIALHVSGFVSKALGSVTALLQALSLTAILAVMEPLVLVLAIA